MPRTEVYQLRLTKDEKKELAETARQSGLSVAQFIRKRCGLGTVGPAAAMQDVVERINAPGWIQPPPLPGDVPKAKDIAQAEALNVLAHRIAAKERVPMAAARREAAKRLKAESRV